MNNAELVMFRFSVLACCRLLIGTSVFMTMMLMAACIKDVSRIHPFFKICDYLYKISIHQITVRILKSRPGLPKMGPTGLICPTLLFDMANKMFLVKIEM